MQNHAVRKIVIILLTLIISAVLIFSNFANSNQQVVYDCDMAEWSPNIPKFIKDECRRLRQEIHRNEQDFSRKKLTTA